MSTTIHTRLDVRPVEPRHRFETIMGAYEALPPGATLELVVDHDPECMYYTLQATRGEEAFAFDNATQERTDLNAVGFWFADEFGSAFMRGWLPSTQ